MDAKGIIIGGGGHAGVLLELLLEQGLAVIGYTNCVEDDAEIFNYSPDEIFLVNGVGSVNFSSLANRRDIFEKFRARGYKFPSIISKHAVVSNNAKICDGVQVMRSSTVQSRAKIGENSLINTGAIVEHDCEIGAHVHIASGAVVCGSVSIGNGTHVGAGSTIIQGVSIGENSLVAAGSVVIRDVPPNSTVMGVPAR